LEFHSGVVKVPPDGARLEFESREQPEAWNFASLNSVEPACLGTRTLATLFESLRGDPRCRFLCSALSILRRGYHHAGLDPLWAPRPTLRSSLSPSSNWMRWCHRNEDPHRCFSVSFPREGRSEGGRVLRRSLSARGLSRKSGRFLRRS